MCTKFGEGAGEIFVGSICFHSRHRVYYWTLGNYFFIFWNIDVTNRLIDLYIYRLNVLWINTPIRLFKFRYHTATFWLTLKKLFYSRTCECGFIVKFPSKRSHSISAGRRFDKIYLCLSTKIIREQTKRLLKYNVLCFIL